MANNASSEASGRKRHWFARRQVYLRTGQDSQYVELSPMLQIGVVLGFGALSLWLIGASYGALSNALGENRETALLAKLGNVEQALSDAEQQRDAALEDASRVSDLEAELVDAREAAARASEASTAETDQTVALTAELKETKAQLDELHVRLSESKADQAALQARFEAEVLATTDASEKIAEEAASLHAQLEEAYGDIETLQKERDDVAAKLAALSEQSTAEKEETDRNTALLKAATAEIERLQEAITLGDTEAENARKDYEATIAKLEEQLGEVVSARDELERDVTDLNAELEAAQAEAADLEKAKALAETEAAAAVPQATVDAEIEALSIAAEAREADLLAEIEDLRAKSATSIAVEEQDAESGELGPEPVDVAALQKRVAIAEAEIERLILVGLRAEDEPVAAPAPAATPAEDSTETKRLRSELLTARADIIKLEADVKASKQRLAEKSEANDAQASKPDNSAKLEQQLASTRSRVQQLNKALADAKLREVAIDLALINVVPTPSPPAPR